MFRGAWKSCLTTHLFPELQSSGTQTRGLGGQVPGSDAELHCWHQSVDLRPAHHQFVARALPKVRVASDHLRAAQHSNIRLLNLYVGDISEGSKDLLLLSPNKCKHETPVSVP